MKKTILALVFVLTATLGFSQTLPKAGTVGLGIDGITGSPNILLKVFLTDRLAGQVIVGTSLDFQSGDAPEGYEKVNGTEFRGGLGLYYHLTNTRVSPYVGVEGIFQTSKAAGFYSTDPTSTNVEPDATNSVLVNGVFGAEFFIDKSFSIGIKETVGADIRLKRDIPLQESRTMLNTNTVLTGRFYF